MQTHPMADLDHLSVHARVALALALARTMLPRLAADVAGHRLAQQAVAEAERWLATGNVSAQALTDLLMDEREQGLLLCEQQCTDAARRRAWIALESAIAYVAWQAWHAEGRVPAALVSEVGDDTLELLAGQAVDAGLSQAAVATLRERVEALPGNQPVNVTKLVEGLS
jgi:hypothetical protein